MGLFADILNKRQAEEQMNMATAQPDLNRPAPQQPQAGLFSGIINKRQQAGFDPNSPSFYASEPDSNMIISEPVPQEQQKNFELQAMREKLIAEGKIKPETSYWNELKKEWMPVVGGTAGSLALEEAAGKATQGMPKPIQAISRLGGAVVGAFGGGMGGKGYEQTYKSLTDPNAPSKTLEQLYAEQKEAGKSQTISELEGRGASKILGKALQPISQKWVKPMAKQVNEVLAKYKAHLLPSQATASSFQDTLQGFAEGAWFGNSKLNQFTAKTQPEALVKYQDDVIKSISKIATNKQQAGEVLADALSDYSQAFHAASGKLYTEVAKKAKTAVVDAVPLKKMATSKLRELEGNPDIGATKAIKDFYEKILNTPDSLSFKKAKRIRSDVLDEGRKLEMELGSKNPKLQREIDLAADQLDRGMGQSAQRISPELYSKWREANAFYRQGKRQFQTKLMKQLDPIIRDNPEKAVDAIFKPGMNKQIVQLQKMIKPQSWQRMKTAFLDGMLAKSEIKTSETTGLTSGNIFLSNLRPYEKQGTLNLIYSPEEVKAIKLIGHIGRAIQDKTGQESGSMAITLAQPGAIYKAASGKKITAGIASITLAPSMISMLITSPKGAKWFTEGVSLPANSPKYAAFITRLLTMNANAKSRISEKEYIDKQTIESAQQNDYDTQALSQYMTNPVK